MVAPWGLDRASTAFRILIRFLPCTLSEYFDSLFIATSQYSISNIGVCRKLAYLQFAMFKEAVIAVFSENEVIQQWDSKDLACFLEPFGDFPVLGRGLGVA